MKFSNPILCGLVLLFGLVSIPAPAQDETGSPSELNSLETAKRYSELSGRPIFAVAGQST